LPDEGTSPSTEPPISDDRQTPERTYLSDEEQIRISEGINMEEKLQMLIHCGLAIIKNARLKITVDKKEVVVRDQVRKAAQAILSAKDFIGTAISSGPHASLAWAGVLVILPVSIHLFSGEEKNGVG
jgi:hypothetical protein